MITNFSFEAETIFGISHAVLHYSNGSLLRSTSKLKKNEGTHFEAKQHLSLLANIARWKTKDLLTYQVKHLIRQQEAKYQPAVNYR